MIWTCDLFVPNEALYQAEPHPVIRNNDTITQKKTKIHTFIKKVYKKLIKYPYKTVDKAENGEYNISVRQDKYRY